MFKGIKKTFVLILVLTIFVTLFAGCKGSKKEDTNKDPGSTSKPTSTQKENFNPTGYPVVDEEITVTAVHAMAKKYVGEGGPDEVSFWKNLRELTNVHIKWNVIEPDETSVTLFFAAGNYPDFFLGSLSNDKVDDLGVQGGLFMDLSEMIYEHMPHMVSRFKEWPQAEKVIRQLDGKIYTLPQVRLGTTAVYGQMFYRTDYLEKVNLPTPKTIDDFYNALKSIKEAGLTEGYAPLLPYNEAHMRTQVEGFLFPAFGDAVEPGFADDGTGKVVYNFTSEQYKRYLQYTNKLYAEKLLEEEIFSIDPATTLARTKSGQAAFMSYAATLMPEDFADGEMHLDCLAPLVSEYTSTQKVAAYPYLSTTSGGINKKSKHPREILRTLDVAYAKEEVAPGTGLKAIAANSGIEGESYSVNDDNTYQFLAPEEWKDDPWTWVRINHGWNVPFGVYDMPYYNKAPNANAREKGMMTNNLPYSVDRFPDRLMKYTADESLDMSNKLTEIDSYIDQMRAKFITGIEPFSKWDDYVATITKMKIDDVLKIKQTAYDRWNK